MKRFLLLLGFVGMSGCSVGQTPAHAPVESPRARPTDSARAPSHRYAVWTRYGDLAAEPPLDFLNGRYDVQPTDSCQDMLLALQRLTTTVKAGDEVLVVIDAHGAPSQGPPESTHSVGLSDGLCSLDRLVPLQKSLEQKGAHIGILDHSCFSGVTLALADTETCVLSAGPDFGTASALFSRSLFAHVLANTDLESAFLATRAEFYDITNLGAPKLSSESGVHAAAGLAPLEDLLLNAGWMNLAKYFPNDRPAVLEPLRRNLRPLLDSDPSVESDLRNLESALAEYRQALKKIAERNPERVALANRIVDVGGKKMTWWELNDAMTNPARMAVLEAGWSQMVIALMKRQKNPAIGNLVDTQFLDHRAELIESLPLPESDKRELRRWNAQIEPIRVTFDALDHTPEFRAFSGRSISPFDTLNRGVAARGVVKLEQKLYQRLYQFFRNQSSARGPETDVCRRFRF